MTKQHFGVALTTLTYWWAPAKMVVCGDESVRGAVKENGGWPIGVRFSGTLGPDCQSSGKGRYSLVDQGAY